MLTNPVSLKRVSLIIGLFCLFYRKTHFWNTNILDWALKHDRKSKRWGIRLETNIISISYYSKSPCFCSKLSPINFSSHCHRIIAMPEVFRQDLATKNFIVKLTKMGLNLKMYLNLSICVSRPPVLVPGLGLKLYVAAPALKL